MLLTKLTNWNC